MRVPATSHSINRNSDTFSETWRSDWTGSRYGPIVGYPETLRRLYCTKQVAFRPCWITVKLQFLQLCSYSNSTSWINKYFVALSARIVKDVKRSFGNVFDSTIVEHDWGFKEDRKQFQDSCLKPRFEVGSCPTERESGTVRCVAVVTLVPTLFWSF